MPVCRASFHRTGSRYRNPRSGTVSDDDTNLHPQVKRLEPTNRNLGRKPLSSFAATARNNSTALFGPHAHPKPVILLATAIVRLKRTFHGSKPF